MSSSTKCCRCDKENGHGDGGEVVVVCRLSLGTKYRGLVREPDPCLSDSLIGLRPAQLGASYRPHINNRQSFPSALRYGRSVFEVLLQMSKTRTESILHHCISEISAIRPRVADPDALNRYGTETSHVSLSPSFVVSCSLTVLFNSAIPG
jgi:hypothetical protein